MESLVNGQTVNSFGSLFTSAHIASYSEKYFIKKSYSPGAPEKVTQRNLL